MNRNFYEILGIERDASPDDIKKAYRKLAAEHHPDKNNGSEESASKFKEINEAYATLGDESNKQAYDRKSSGSPNPQQIWEDIFSPFSSRAREAAHRSSINMPGDDAEIQCIISFAESFHGTKISIDVEALDRCSTCSGTGAKPGSRMINCGTCAGLGFINDMFIPIKRTCISCHGDKTRPIVACVDCKGSKYQVKKSKLAISIPEGVRNGDVLRIPQKGKPGNPPGDLFLRMSVTPLDSVQRKDDDIKMETEAPLDILASGGDFTFKTQWNTEHSVSIDPNSTDMVYEIPKAGFKTKRRTGGLIVKIRPSIPSIKSNRAKKLLKELLQETNQE